MLHHVIGKGTITQKLCHLTTEIDKPPAYLEVVRRIVIYTECVTGHVEFFAQFTLRAVHHKRSVARCIQSEYPSLLSVLFCSLVRCFPCRFRQTVKLFFIQDVQRIGLVLLQQVLRELQRKHGGLFREPAQTVFPCLIQQCTAAYETVVAVLQQPVLLRCQLTMVLVYIFDTLEQLGVQADIVAMPGEYRAHLLSQSIHLIIGFGT